ncbi:hypothetical protein ACSHT2_33250 [Bradyrhizobium sp. PUT101]|uniref:hypothetical protein n=1 Tax=Bradyrhizobium sp. PUT101 TaxID=3447427 RepID=UPI003F82A990
MAVAVILCHSAAVCCGLPAEQLFYDGLLKPVVRLIVPASLPQRTPRCRKPRAERPAGVHHAAGYQIFPAQTFAVLFVATALALRDIVGGRPASPAAPPGGMLALAFLCGVALFLNRTRIAFSRRLLLLSLIGFVASVLASNRNREDLAALFVSYLAVYLGLPQFSTSDLSLGGRLRMASTLRIYRSADGCPARESQSPDAFRIEALSANHRREAILHT